MDKEMPIMQEGAGSMNDRLLSQDAINRIKAFAEDESIEWVDVHGDIWNLLAAYSDTMRENERLCSLCRLAQISLEYHPAEKHSGVVVALESLNEALSNKESERKPC
jgi:hypothetical protein